MSMQPNRFPFPGGNQRDVSSQNLSSNYTSANAKWPANAIWKSRSDTTDMWPSSSSPWNTADSNPPTRQASDSPTSARIHDNGLSLHDLANAASSSQSYLAAIGPTGTYDPPRPKPSAVSTEAGPSPFKYPSSLRDSVADDGHDTHSTSSPYTPFGLLDGDALAPRKSATLDHSNAFTSTSAAASVSSSTFSASAAPVPTTTSNVTAGSASGMPSYGSFGALSSSQHGHSQRPSLQTSTSFSSPSTQPNTISYHRNSQPEDASTLDLALRFRRKTSREDQSPDSTPNALSSNNFRSTLGAYSQASSTAPFRFDPGSQPWDNGSSGVGTFDQSVQYDLDQVDATAYAATRGSLGVVDQRPPLASSYGQEGSSQNVAAFLDVADSMGPPLPHDPRTFYSVPAADSGGISHSNLLQNYIQKRQLATAADTVAVSFGGNSSFFPHNLAAYSLYNNYRAPMQIPALGMPMPQLPGSFLPTAHLSMSRDRDPAQSLRSPLLDEFRSSRTNRRYELKDIYNHIVEFSGDQHGSRFIQSKLETANSDEKEHVFCEISANTLALMKDVFGNYVVQRFFEHGNQVQKKYLAEQMRGKMVDLSTQTYACRVVQKALQHILVDQQVALAKELEADVIRVIKDQNGNHVIQKVIELVPREHIDFIMDAFRGQVRELSAHNFGCRVVQRMLEYGSKEDKDAILTELHASTENLIMDQFGNYVIQHVIQFGDPDDRSKVIGKVVASLVLMSRHKFASNVVEKCIEYGTAADCCRICDELEKDTGNGKLAMDQLIKDQYGNYVIQRLLKELEPEERQRFAALLSSRLDTLKDSTRQNGAVDRLIAVVVELLKIGENGQAIAVQQQGVGNSGSTSPASSQSQVQLRGDSESTPSLTSSPDTPESSKPPSVGTGPAGESVRVATNESAVTASSLRLNDPCTKKLRSTSQSTIALVQ